MAYFIECVVTSYQFLFARSFFVFLLRDLRTFEYVLITLQAKN